MLKKTNLNNNKGFVKDRMAMGYKNLKNKNRIETKMIDKNKTNSKMTNNLDKKKN